MNNRFKAIAISLIPNFSWRDLFWLGAEIPARMVLFENGRTAGHFLLKSLGVGSGDEVIIQAFTCVAVPNLVAWTGAKPVYVDVDDTLNIDPEKLKKAITPKTKAVIFQNTFGNPGQKEKIQEICKREKIFFIDDCAHTAKTDCDLAFFSFGRDKVVSGPFGGGAILSNKIKDKRSGTKEWNLEKRGWVWLAGQVAYLLVSWFVLNTYQFFGIGKFVHKLLRPLLPKVLTAQEKRGEKPEKFYGPPPGVLAQWGRQDNFIAHRKKLARYYAEQLGGKYDDSCSYLRYNIFVDDPEGLRKFAAKQNVFLGDWYDSVVAPKGVDLEKVGYRMGSCPKAEEYSRRIVNLPTSPSMSLEDAARVVAIVKAWKK